jgi:spoIIIJ-associated protein
METEIKKIIEEFLSKTGLNFDSVSGDLDMDSGVFWFSIKSPDSNFLIGRNGEALSGINYLIKRILENKFKENTPKVTIDINEYQKAKIEKLKTIAHMMAERARFFKSKVELDPMTSFERLIVHEYVSKHSDLKSESEGFGPNRRVTISFVK